MKARYCPCGGQGKVLLFFDPRHNFVLCPCRGQGRVASQALFPYVALLEGSVPLWRAMLALLLYAPRLFLLGPRFLKPRFLFSSFLHLQ